MDDARRRDRILRGLPQAAAAGFNRLIGLGLEVQSAPFQASRACSSSPWWSATWSRIRRVPEIRRVFQYHGAEHKTISTYEAGEELDGRGTLARRRRCTRAAAPRSSSWWRSCQSSSSRRSARALPRIHTGSALLDNVVFFLEKLPFLPVIAAVTFELQRIFARYCSAGPLRASCGPAFSCRRSRPPNRRRSTRGRAREPARDTLQAGAGARLPERRRRGLRELRGAPRRRPPASRGLSFRSAPGGPGGGIEERAGTSCPVCYRGSHAPRRQARTARSSL